MELKHIEILDQKKRVENFNYIIGEFLSINESSAIETVSSWAERKRVLGSSVAAYAGPYSFDRTPYLKEIVDCLSESSPVTEVAIMKGTQIGATTGILENHIGYCIDNGIGSILYVGADQAMAEASMEKRIDEMIVSANLQDKIVPTVIKRSNKSTGDTKSAKSYKGGSLRAIGPNSEGKLRSFPCRVLYLDEVDVYPISMKGKGNPIEKALRRADSYGPLKKVLYISTPKEASTSQIEPIYKQGDMRKFYVPCKDCGHMQYLSWSNLKWEKTEDGDINMIIENDIVVNDPVYYECEKCKSKWRNSDKSFFLKNGEWRPTKNSDRPGLRTYHLSGLYSPAGFRSWLDAVIQFVRVKDDPVLFADFVNDFWGETFSEDIDKPDETYLQSRLESDWSRGDIHEDVKVLTLGVDIHPKRIDWHLMGWSDNKESWSVDFDSIYGNIWETFDESWDKLEEIINKEYVKLNGDKIPLHMALIDAQGQASPTVKSFCERFPYSNGAINGVYPTLGKTNVTGVVKEVITTIVTPELLIDDQRLKREVYNNLKKKKPTVGERYPYGFMHFHSDYHEDFFKQLTSEEISEVQNTKGTHTEYFIHNKKQRDNHVLDCTKMCLAGLYHMYFKYFKSLNENQKKHKRKEIPASWDVFWNLFNND